MNPEYPVYVISKGRADTRLTAKALDYLRVPYHIVIEPQEYDEYARVISTNKILVLPFSNLGQGSIPARNWVWENSIENGDDWHWILDDNIREFYRMHANTRIRVNSGTIFKAAEDFVNRYENVAQAGFQYSSFGIGGMATNKPFLLNTRIYSCILLRNDLGYRWRGRYNEDTDLSLRMLKDGWCTILFYAFLANKQTTMTMTGGNTEDLYKLDNEDGRLLMAQSLQKQHPDVVTITRKWGRWQHKVNYKPFKANRLIKKKGLKIKHSPDNYGMSVKKVSEIA